MVDSDVFQNFVEYPPENGTITKILYEYDMAAPINEHPDCSEQCLRDVEDLVEEPEDDVADIKLCGTKIIKVEPDRYRAIREKTNYEDVPPHPNILKISHFTYHERSDCYVFVYDLGCEVKTLSEFVKTATSEDQKCLVKQVIELVQHFHTHCILYGHLQPDLMYVALSGKDRKPHLKVGSFLKTAFCDTRTEIPDFSGSCKEESTMLEDLKDAAHVIAYIYNEGDTAKTTDTANSVMKELLSMSLDIEKRAIESVMLQMWSEIDIINDNQSLVLYNFTGSSQQSEQNVVIKMSMTILYQIWSYLKSKLHHENLLFDLLEEMIVDKNWDEFRACMKNCAFSSFEIVKFAKSDSTLSHPGIEIKWCNGCTSSSTNCIAADEKCSEQTEEKRFKSFPTNFDVMYNPTLPASSILANVGFSYLSERHVIQLLVPCEVPEDQFQTNMVKKVRSCSKRFFDPGQTKGKLAIKDKA